MGRLEITETEVILHLGFFEWMWSFSCCCGGFKYPLSSIKSVRSCNTLWDEMRGVRVGTGIPCVVMLGTRMHSEGKDFCAVYCNYPGLVIEFNDQSYKRWVFSVDKSITLAAELEAKIGAGKGV